MHAPPLPHRRSSPDVYSSFHNKILLKKIFNRIKSILTFIVLGYSDKCIQSNILFNESNLRSLGIDKDYLIFQLVAAWEEYRVFENRGKIGFKPNLDLRIFYKILFC